jgi:hypothetical protein
MPQWTVAEVVELAALLRQTTHAEPEVRELSCRYDAGTLTFAQLIAALRALTVRH